MATAAAKAAAEYCAQLQCDALELLANGRIVPVVATLATMGSKAYGTGEHGHHHGDGDDDDDGMHAVEEGVTYGSSAPDNYSYLDARGWVSVAELAIYVPILVIAVVLMSSASDRIWRRQWKWIYLNVLALLRVAGAAILLAAELSNPDPFLFAGTYALINSGVAPLVMISSELLATIGSPFLAEIPNAKHFFRGVLAFAIPSIIFATIGGMDSSASSQGGVISGNIFRKLSAFSLLGAFLILVQLHVLYWVVYRHRLEENKKHFLALSGALLLLLVRILYQILSSFSQNLFDTPPNSQIHTLAGMAPFNAITGNVPIYIFMALLPEVLFIIICVFVGTRTTEATSGYTELDTSDELDEPEASWRSDLLAGTHPSKVNMHLRRSETTVSERSANVR